MQLHILILYSHLNGFSEERVKYVCLSHYLQTDDFIFKGAHIQNTSFPHRPFGKLKEQCYDILLIYLSLVLQCVSLVLWSKFFINYIFLKQF